MTAVPAPSPAMPPAAGADASFVFASMGTVVSIRSTEEIPPPVRRTITDTFDELEDRYSTYRPHSEASAVAAGRLAVRHGSAAFRDTYDQAVAWRVRTGGAFDRTDRTG